MRQAIRQFIRESFLFGGEDSFLDTDSFLELGIIDSTGVLELVGFLEGRWELSIGDEELVPENLDSIENLVRFIERKRGAVAAGGAMLPA